MLESILSRDLNEALTQTSSAVDEMIDLLIPAPEDEKPENQLIDAMRYSTLSGGKRLRPFFVLATSELFSVSYTCAVRTASAIEILHSYSLIHDDLPAMDDSAMRRGLESCHVRFDEATAILAGDALLTLAFEVLSNENTHSDPAVRCSLVKRLAAASGPYGMVGGQMLDMLAKDNEYGIGAITRLQRLKTGELFGFACEAGAILGRAPLNLRHALHAYAQNIGLAFQICDDLLDVEGSTTATGKLVRKDIDADKATFVKVLGRDRAREQMHFLAEQAIGHLKVFGSEAELLREAAMYMIERDR